MTFSPDSPWTDVDGIAARLGVTRKTIYDWMKLDPPLPSAKVGGKGQSGRRRFYIPAVDEWAQSRWSLHMGPNGIAS
jgi:predicted DNA-binding transcriptional regulator AlpA